MRWNERTARNRLHRLGQRWTLEPSGQYVNLNGHERYDVIKYRQDIFLPRWITFGELTLHGNAEDNSRGFCWSKTCLVPWWVNLLCKWLPKKRWCHVSEKAVPSAKGEGASLTDFVSADYGWLRSPDGLEAARVLSKHGKKGKASTSRMRISSRKLKIPWILFKSTLQMMITSSLSFIFDNATTHLKRPDTALSARKMTKGPSNILGLLSLWTEIFNTRRTVNHINAPYRWDRREHSQSRRRRHSSVILWWERNI